MSFVYVAMGIMLHRSRASRERIVKQVDHVLIHGSLVRFERQHILAVLLFDLPGDLGQAAHGVDAHDAARQFQLLQQQG